MLVEGGRPAENLRRADEFIAQAAQAGAAVVLLPETLDFGWGHSSARKEAGEIPGGDKDALIEYIKSQPEHHKKLSFRDVLREFLVKFGVQFDEKYLV